MEFVMGLCSSVTVMNQGSNLVSGLPADIRTNPLVLDAYLGGDDEESDEVANG
jgi:ABC-type branched-subunit amino acid transport system ATPase component